MFSRMKIVLAVVVGLITSTGLFAADVPPAASVKRAAPVGAGDTAPDFTLEDQSGRVVNLSAEWKKQPVVLIFYRGHW